MYMPICFNTTIMKHLKLKPWNTSHILRGICMWIMFCQVSRTKSHYWHSIKNRKSSKGELNYQIKNIQQWWLTNTTSYTKMFGHFNQSLTDSISCPDIAVDRGKFITKRGRLNIFFYFRLIKSVEVTYCSWQIVETEFGVGCSSVTFDWIKNSWIWAMTYNK